MIEEALAGYLRATILALKPHLVPIASWDDPDMPAAAIVLDDTRRQITWTPGTGWRHTRLHPSTGTQDGPAHYLAAGPVPAPRVVADRLHRWQAGGPAWTVTQPHYRTGDVLEALRRAVPDPADEDACCQTCGTRLPAPPLEAARAEHDNRKRMELVP